MFYHLNIELQRIEITAPCGYIVAFIEYRHFGNSYGYFAAMLGGINF